MRQLQKALPYALSDTVHFTVPNMRAFVQPKLSCRCLPFDRCRPILRHYDNDVAASPYFFGMTPTEIQIVAPAFIESFKRAAKEGYDDVVPLGTLDLDADGAKSAVDIPAIGPTEAALHVASLVGDRFGMIVYHQRQMPFLRAIVRRYGMEHHVVEFSVTDLDCPTWRRTMTRLSRTSSTKLKG